MYWSWHLWNSHAFSSKSQRIKWYKKKLLTVKNLEKPLKINGFHWSALISVIHVHGLHRNHWYLCRISWISNIFLENAPTLRVDCSTTTQVILTTRHCSIIYSLEKPLCFLRLKTQSAVENCKIHDFQFWQFWISFGSCEPPYYVGCSYIFLVER